MSAVQVSRACYDRQAAIEGLNPALREDLAALAGLFYARGDFATVFLNLVPWNDFVGPPNSGHAAIADLLVSRAAHAALSANFDTLIERWAEDRKIALRGALTGQEAISFVGTANPLLKFHGCLARSRETTIWTLAQLTDPVIQPRVTSCSQWINLHLPGKHLVVAGFWSDWGYLNDVLAAALTITNAQSVTVIDPSPSAVLAAKAPLLWARLHDLSGRFEHIPESSETALDQLRTAYSRAWTRRFFTLGAAVAAQKGLHVPPSPFETLNGDALYDVRRDAEGEPYSRASTHKSPPQGAAQAAFLYVLMVNAGATPEGPWLSHHGRSIRIINGAGRELAQVRESYKEPGTVPAAEIIVCAGALDFGVPARVVPSGRGASTVRPAPGGSSVWWTFDQAKTALGI